MSVSEDEIGHLNQNECLDLLSHRAFSPGPLPALGSRPILALSRTRCLVVHSLVEQFRAVSLRDFLTDL